MWLCVYVPLCVCVNLPNISLMLSTHLTLRFTPNLETDEGRLFMEIL